ncbi:serine/threonine protein phosphatase [Sedimentitalea sp. CY04]|uniref:Serine/threonine protein phosphatase n=1 Tax=Parasedimentitalea denitrificans TaxID=2211118 RepID=A0ABX0WDR4_9RHOB|nr:metallophosphoesterase [Sedimentitalea sp. CY04]NIZ62998.1 serine/threonine protein phosphatase [Sedimentitalea sp. CY04]
MLIAHISDFHVFAHAPETSLVRKDAADAARKVVADIAAHTPLFDAVIFTGDLADGGSAADYELLKEILAPLNMPVFVVPGNHDKRDGLRAAFQAIVPFGPGPYLHYEACVGDLRILALDTLVNDKVYGALDPSQLDWLESRLAEHHSGPTIIAMHHPPFPSGVTALDDMSLRDGKEPLARIVADCDTPLIILAGHIHRPFQAIWFGAFCQVGGGPSFQHALDLGLEAPEPGSISEPYAYLILRLDGPDTLTNHKRYVSL